MRAKPSRADARGAVGVEREGRAPEGAGSPRVGTSPPVPYGGAPRSRAAEERRRAGLRAGLARIGCGPSEAAAAAEAMDARDGWSYADVIREMAEAPSEEERKAISRRFRRMWDVTERWIEEGRAADAARRR